MTFRPERLLVPVITPFDEAGRVAEDALERHADEVLAAGAAGIVADTLQLLAAAPPSFGVLGGDDAFLFPLVLMGGAGAIAASANVATDRYAAMIEAGLAGRLTEGRRHTEALLPLTLALFAEP